MSYSLSPPIIDLDTDIKYQEYEDYTHIITEVSLDDSDNDIMLTLSFPLNNKNINIKIYKYSCINVIPIFIKDHFGLSNIKMIYNYSVITHGTFYSLNIQNNSTIKIINHMKTGFTDIIGNTLNPVEFLFLLKSKPRNIKSKLSREEINNNIDQYGFWGAYTKTEEQLETLETPKKKVKKNTYKSPEHIYRHEKIDPSELENLGKKYHIAMDELYEREKKEKIEEDKIRSKISLLKEKMKKSKDKKLKNKKSNDKTNKVVEEEKKETFCGFKKGFLL